MTPKDPTEPLKKAAANFPNVAVGASCNQTSYKVGKVAFFYIGPAPKAAKIDGYKAMFRLGPSLAQAKELAAKNPERIGVGKTQFVSVMFTADKPMAKRIWQKWLKESYELAAGN